MTRERFAADLAEKNWILLLEEDGRLRGFSTLRIYETAGPGGEPLTVVYSGDTIVEQGAWATAALPKSWIAAVRALRERSPARPSPLAPSHLGLPHLSLSARLLA